MTGLELNAQIWRDIAEIAEDEVLMKRLAKYLKRLTAQKKDPTEMTYDEFTAMVHEAEVQYKRGEYTTQLPGESVSEMLKRCGYGV